MNRLRLSIFLFLATLIVVYFLRDLIGPDKKDVKVVLDDISKLNCESKEKQIKVNLDRLSVCKNDTDCTVVAYKCPFGCYNAVNKHMTLDQIEDQIKEYADNCSLCVYNCGTWPEQSNIRCVDNKCQVLQ